MAISWLALAVGAVLGASLRFVSQKLSLMYWGNLESGTLLANLVGCFAIGMIYPLLSEVSEPVKLLLITGLLGSLTTLSSLMLETVLLLGGKRPAAGWLYLAFTTAVGLGACGLGLRLGQWFATKEPLL